MQGKPPVGYVAPWWEFSLVTNELLLKKGICYDHSLMHDDFRPYYVRVGDSWTKIEYAKHPREWMKPLQRGRETDLVEIPASWYLDDLPPMMFIKAAPQILATRDSSVEDALLCGPIHASPEAASAALPGDGAHEHRHASGGGRHGGIEAFTITLDEPLDWTAFALWLTMLLNRHGGRILRVKGLLHMAGAETPVVIHGVQHAIHPPVHLDAWPEGDRRTSLTVIARGLPRASLAASLVAFNRPASARGDGRPA